MYIGDWHNGIDIAAVYGAPIHSPTAATVLASAIRMISARASRRPVHRP